MSAITGCRLMAPNYDGKLWNGRQRAAHARAAWPGNTFRISPDGWGCVYRRMDKEARCGKELSDIRHLNQAPLKYCDGSTGVAPLRISKCNCGEVTLPVWPACAITWPRFTVSPRLTRMSLACA